MSVINLSDTLTPPEIQELMDWLNQHNFRVTKGLEQKNSYCSDTPTEPLIRAAILDTETTGVNVEVDKVIELGFVVFDYAPTTGQVYNIVRAFNGLEDPEMYIPPESQRIHHITDEMVAMEKFDDAEIEKALEDVNLIIAHRAEFDRPFIEKRLPFFKNKAWACSLTQIPWLKEGITGMKLEFLAYINGFHYDGHRADNDCRALLEVLQRPLPVSGELALKVLLENARQPELKIYALNAGFDVKDKLKERRYRWNADRKLWGHVVALPDMPTEIAWLRTEIYHNKPFKLEQETVGPKVRFSNRVGPVEIVDYFPEAAMPVLHQPGLFRELMD